MKSLYHFFRLIRPLNLAVIGLTMGVFQYYLNDDQISSLYQFDFLLLVFSTLLIAAAGNIINDYFDVKADRVNKPEQLIIDVHIKRRVAILMNWIFNSFALLIAFYLSWKCWNWWIIVISLISINILWFYSMYFKRTFLLGNVFVAFLTGIVPLYVLVFDPNHNVFESRLIWIFCGYAFWINLIREIVKDLADIKGDLLLNSRTIPIILGIRKTKIILGGLYIIAISPLIYVLGVGFMFFQISPDLSSWDLLFFIFVGLIFLCLVIGLILLLRQASRKYYLISSNLLKLAMLFGLLTPLFL